MHIEPGFLAQAKIMGANLAAGGVLLSYAKNLISRPADMLRTVLAAVFFSLFMQSFHMNVGPSELHFVGAMVIYLSFGFVPTLFGFALGLLLQGLIFAPADLVHLAVNSLSLILPLIAVHFTLGRKLREQSESLRWQQIVKLDASYYAGVTAMVGFWLSMSEVATPVSAWASFAASYLVVIAAETLLTYAFVNLIKRQAKHPVLDLCFAVKR